MEGNGEKVYKGSGVDDYVIPRITTTPDIDLGEQPQDAIKLHSTTFNATTTNTTNTTATNNNNKPFPNSTVIANHFTENHSYPEATLDPRNKELNTSCSSIGNDTIYLFVSGKSFCISKSALMRFPHTKLGRLASYHTGQQGRVEYVFDRNSKIVAAVLDLYRTGELHLPRNLCSLSIRRELRYWGIPDDLISECCFGRYKDALKEMSIVDELVKISWTRPHPRPGSYQDWIWNIMEKPGSSSLSWIWLGIYMSFILLSVILVCISTMRRFRVDREIEDPGTNVGSIFDNLINTKLSTALSVFDVIGLLFFTIEPLVRLWASPSRGLHLQEFLNLLDLFLATDHWMCLCLESSDTLMNRHRPARIAVTVFRSVLSLRVLRIFHLTRKNVKTKVLLLTFRASLIDILLLLLGLSMGVITFATLIYYAEMIYDTENFKNIPEAIWWAIITMTTVGYGDYYPTTFPGYVVGVACALCGLLLLSMPIAVTATNFTTYYCGLAAREQRLRRNAALQNYQAAALKTKRKYSSDVSSFTGDDTNSTSCGDESKDDVFWFDDFGDYKCHYQSDGALNIQNISKRCRSFTHGYLFQTSSENSLFPRATPPRPLFPNDDGDKLNPDHARPRSKSREKTNASSLIINSDTVKAVPNYNSIKTDQNSKKTCQDTDNGVQNSKARIDSGDAIKRRRKKYRARRKTRGSSLHVTGSNFQSDGND